MATIQMQKKPVARPVETPADISAELEKAHEHLRKAVTLNQGTAAYQYALAQAEFLAGNFSASADAAERSLQADPANYDALLLLAETLLRLKRYADTWTASMQAIKLDKYREDAWMLAARSAAEAGEGDKAIQCLELFLKVNKDQLVGPLPYILLARTYLDTGQPQTALEQVEQALAKMRSFYIAPGPYFLALRAQVLRHLKQPVEALEYYRQALQMSPQDPALHNELGEAVLEQNKPLDALRSFRQAVELDPNSALYHYNAGTAARRAAVSQAGMTKQTDSLPQQAVELLLRATDLNPVVAKYWYELALAYKGINNYREMKLALQQAIAQSTVFTDAEAPQVGYMRLYAWACQRLGDFDSARETLKSILAILPNDHITLNDMGELSYKLGNFKAAFNYFRKAETIANDHPRYLANLSRAMVKLDRPEEARELVEEAARIDPKDYYVRFQLGAVLLDAGQADQALEHLQEAASKEPDNAEFRYYLGRAYLNTGHISEAIHHYLEAVNGAPLKHQWQAELGEIYLREHAYVPALEHLRLAAQLEPGEPVYRYNLAIAQASNGDLQAALYTLREALRTFGDFAGAEWYYLEGKLLTENGRLDEALESFVRANHMEPGNPDYKVDLAKVLRLKGAPVDRVRPLLDEALTEDPESLRAYEELAYTLEQSNQDEAAVQTLEARINEVLSKV
ncbi:MAG: tetratricopeptide repeat protein [Chloroflexi bacterium]|nr:tetratricopeptide repeat protein [Chloroflexota bacterium]